MFRLNKWKTGQDYVVDPFAKPPVTQPQDCAQLWFAGVHSDVGGGYPEAESGLAKIPLVWMIEQAVANGLRIDKATFDRLALGEDPKYSKPDPLGPIHNSLTWIWWGLEILPKSARWREWRRWSLLGFYLPLGEPRPLPERPDIHPSALERREKAADPRYDPVNLRQRNWGRKVPPEWPIWRFWRVILIVFASGALGAATVWLIARILRCLFC
jgi:hypothetical protein